MTNTVLTHFSCYEEFSDLSFTDSGSLMLMVSQSLGREAGEIHITVVHFLRRFFEFILRLRLDGFLRISILCMPERVLTGLDCRLTVHRVLQHTATMLEYPGLTENLFLVTSPQLGHRHLSFSTHPFLKQLLSRALLPVAVLMPGRSANLT